MASEISTWGWQQWLLLAQNFALSFGALIVSLKRGCFKRLSFLRLYLHFSVAVAFFVPMLVAGMGMDRHAYRSLYEGVEIVNNILLVALAWQLTRTVLPSLKLFIGLWSATLGLIVGYAYWRGLASDAGFNYQTSLVLSLMALLAAFGVIAIAALMPFRYWSREYGFVAAGILAMIGGIIGMTLVQLNWVTEAQWMRMLVGMAPIPGYCLFLLACFQPVVADHQHLGGFNG